MNRPLNQKHVTALATVALRDPNASLRIRVLRWLRDVRYFNVIRDLTQVIQEPTFQHPELQDAVARSPQELFLATLILAQRGVPHLEPLLVDGLRENATLMSLTDDDAEILATYFAASRYPVPIETARLLCDSFILERLFDAAHGAYLNFVGYTIETELAIATQSGSWDEDALVLDEFLIGYHDSLLADDLPRELKDAKTVSETMVRDPKLARLLASTLTAIQTGQLARSAGPVLLGATLADELFGYEIAEEIWNGQRQ